MSIFSENYINLREGLCWWLSGTEPTCQCRRCGFNPWVGKIPWRREWHSSIITWKVPWTEEPGGPQSLGSQKSQTRLSFPCFLSHLVLQSPVQTHPLLQRKAMPLLPFLHRRVEARLWFSGRGRNSSSRILPLEEKPATYKCYMVCSWLNWSQADFRFVLLGSFMSHCLNWDEA